VRTYISVPVIAARLLSATGAVAGGLARSPVGRLGTWLLGSDTGGPDEETRRHDVFPRRHRCAAGGAANRPCTV